MGIKGHWKRRTVSVLLALAMMLSLLPTAILAADTRSATDNAIKNGSFEQPECTSDASPLLEASKVPGWNTTASRLGRRGITEKFLIFVVIRIFRTMDVSLRS